LLLPAAHALNTIADDASTRMSTQAGHDVDAHIESGLLMGSPYGHLTGIVRLRKKPEIQKSSGLANCEQLSEAFTSWHRSEADDDARGFQMLPTAPRMSSMRHTFSVVQQHKRHTFSIVQLLNVW